MKNLRFNELLLASQIESRARRVPLHPTATVIRGENDTGKSSLVKSIYRTLGAEPQNIHPRWEDANVISSLRFSVDDDEYRMIRFGSRYALFDGNDGLIYSVTSVTNELAPKLADLFSFHLRLRTHDTENQATPAFLFLPFYIDQDRGWQQTWNSFARLGQFQNWRSDVTHFHTGIRPSDYYLAKALASAVAQEAQELRQKRDNLISVLDDIQARLGALKFDLDIEAFSNDVEELLQRCSALRAEEEKIRLRMTDTFNTKRGIEEQIDIVKAALHELREDRQFATNLVNDSVHCPTCHAVYENGFAERFEIALDEDSCLGLLSELDEQKREADKRFQEFRASTAESMAASAEIEKVLATTTKEIALRDVLRREGQKDVSESLRRDIDELNAKIGPIDERQAEAEKKMNSYTKKKLQAEIKTFYFSEMQRLLQRLSVVNIPEKTYKRIDASIKETGSDLPRAILAYYFAILHTIHRYSSSTFCPLVIDSPRQQDQDETNWRRMLVCIDEERPKGAQLILALADDMQMDFGGDVINLNDKHQVLTRDDYESVMDELRPLIDASLDVGEIGR